MKKIALFASGSGSNVENIITYFSNKNSKVEYLILVNNPKAKVIEKVEKRNLPVIIFDRDDLKGVLVENALRDFAPDLIVLAGFLWKFPTHLVQAFPNKIINIHPALLPKYGGKGMYGQHVHQAVFENKEEYSGITIHFVNEFYDEGAPIFQKEVFVGDCANGEEIGQRVLTLEHENFPVVIEELLKNE